MNTREDWADQENRGEGAVQGLPGSSGNGAAPTSSSPTRPDLGSGAGASAGLAAISPDAIPTGKFAELNCVTKKTLRLYREMGLLVPVRVDEETGYGFYSLDQCSTIDMIQQLRSLGVPLARIKELTDHEQHGLSTLLRERLDAIDHQIVDLLIARQNASQLLANCRWCHRDPIYDTPILEHLAARPMLTFEILNPASVHLGDDVEQFMHEWELNLRLTKRLMLDRGLPLSLFHHVGCRIARESLTQRRLDLDASFIFIDDVEVARHYETQTFPAGDYVTMYKQGYVEDGHRNAEVAGLAALLAYVEERGFKIAGDYYGQIIAETPAFHCEGREMLFKLMVPVRLDG